MKSPLHILHLEDSLNDAALVKTKLAAEGIVCSISRVQTQDDFLAALERGGVDLVFSDFSLPAFDGLSAVKILRTRWPDLPVILVSATLGEERAIDALKSGATDYVFKDRLSRLAPALRRAMQEVEERAKRQWLEAQFVEAQKMEVLGQLAAGVAHDFNNILAVIMGYSELMVSGQVPENRQREYAEEIRHASQRAAGLTRQLLVFSRKQTVQPVVLDLNDVARDLDKMLRRFVDENIQMTMVFGPETGRVKADCGYIGQVLMNLVVNARDAMPSGGRLTIETGNVTLGHGDTRTRSGALPGDYVMFSVSDTGTGMTDEVKAHMFEAFFTTKPKGKGTGLGLATCQTIVQQCGGHISVCSEVGKGTTFQVCLPRVEQPLDSDATHFNAGPLPRGTETLLIVEDEPAVRQLAAEVFAAQGYNVLCAGNGGDGLRVAREHKGAPIRLVVTDIIMPLMGGTEMMDLLKATLPDLKILYTSGYTEDSILQRRMRDPGVKFLAKPYSSAMLTRKVRELLDDPDAKIK